MTNSYTLFEQARKQRPNPFALEPIIADKEVWGEVMTNLPSLNQHIDQKIFDAVFEVQHKYSNKIGIAIKGDRGTGKSHIIHRVWKKIAQEGGAVFAYMSVNCNHRRINSHVREYLVQSFEYQDTKGVTQWQKLATSVLSTLKGTEFEEKYQTYLKLCDSPNELRKLINNSYSKDSLTDFFDELGEAILENQPNINSNFLKAVLFLLLKNAKDAKIALAWIKGEDNSEVKKIGLPEFSPDEQDDKSIWMIQQICNVAEIASLPVLICFDQIDGIKTDSDCGDSPSEAIAKCIDRIYFQCSNVILICCLMSDRWREIEQMGSGIPDRVGQCLVTAQPPNVEQMIELVKLRLNWFYKNKNLNADDYPDLYPFEQSQIRIIASEAPGVRSLMKWCAEKFEESVPTLNPREKKKQELLDIYNNLRQDINIPMKDDDSLATIISLAIKMIPNEGIEDITIFKVSTVDNPLHNLHLTVSGYDKLLQRDVKIGVRVCETTNGNTFNAVMKRLLNNNEYNITRGCLVRSTPVPLSWKSGQKLQQQLVSEKGGEIVVLKKDEIRPLVAIKRIYDEAENYGFTKEEVINFIKELRLAADNRLVCEILSAPM